MPDPRSTAFTTKTVVAEGLGTRVLEAGDGPPVVLLHSGEYGASAETSWQLLLPALATAGYRAVAPDWLGFGEADKVVDFADPAGRRLRHMRAVLDALEIQSPAIIGSSMGATVLIKDLASDKPLLDARVAVLSSGGGMVPDNAARRSILDYDLTVEGMRHILDTMMHDKRLVSDDEYVAWRHRISLSPGAWQCAASARLRPPTARTPSTETSIGRPDTTSYDRVGLPVLIIAGAEDPLRLPGYGRDLVDAIPDAELAEYEDCGHMPNLEHPERFARDVVSFLDRRFLPHPAARQ